MILILADSTDPWAILIYREARRSGAEVRWVEPAHLLDRVVLNWPVEAESVIVRGSLAIDDTIIPLSDLTGVFSRLTLPLPSNSVSFLQKIGITSSKNPRPHGWPF